MEKFLKYIEAHPFIRISTILSVFVGLTLAFPAIRGWFSNSNAKNEIAKSQTSDLSSFKEYFIPTHKICLNDSSFITIRSKSLTKQEIKESNLQTVQGKIIDANTIIGELNHCSNIKLLAREDLSIKMQYWDGVKLIIGYIPENTQLKAIEPVLHNPYGIRNGQISVYTTKETGVEKIFLDDELVGTLNYYFSEEPNCDDSSGGVFSMITKAGEHLIMAEDTNGYTWRVHVTVCDGQCSLINISD